MEKACFIAKMSGPAIVRPASSDFWKVPGVWQLENFSPGQGLPLLFKISFEIRTNLSWVRLFAPKSWQPCWIPVHKYGENRWMEPLSATDPDTPWATFTLSCSLPKKNQLNIDVNNTILQERCRQVSKKGGKHGLYGNPDTSHLQAPINSRRIQLQESLPILHKVSKLI